MFATPVVYPASIVPEDWRWLFYLNPMAGLIEGFRSAFLDRPFDFTALAISLGMSIFLFLIGVAYFEKVERRFADII
jgi:lipopolysaccharide transport system permease protein